MQSFRRLIIVFVLILLLAAAGGYFYKRARSGAFSGNRQVVFLTNGEILFGNLTFSSSEIVELHNVFSPQSPDQLRGGNKKITLQQLQDEIYGPQDTLYINKKNILYYANLRGDSKINDAITRFNDAKSKATPTPSASSSASPTP